MNAFPDDFDPESVPRWPVYVLELNRGGKTTTATLEGQLLKFPPEINVQDDQEVANAAMDQVAALIAQRALPSARVNAIDTEGNRWQLIVGANGERYSLTPDTAIEVERRHRPWLWPTVAVATVAVLAGVSIATAAVWSSHRGQVTAAVSAPQPSATPAELPTFAPAGATTHARWAYGPVAPGTAVVIAQDRIAVLGKPSTNSTSLIVLDTATGHPIWEQPLDASSVTGLWLTTIGGQRALMTASAKAINWRPVDQLDQNHQIDLQQGTTVAATPDGAWYQHGQHAWIIHSTTVSERIIPAGATIRGITGDTLIATDTTGALWNLDKPSLTTPDPVRLPAPTAGWTYAGTVGWQAGTLATIWRSTSDQQLVFFDQTGKKTGTAPVKNGAAQAITKPLTEPWTLVGSTAVNVGSRSGVDMPSTFMARSIVGTRVYGTEIGKNTSTAAVMDVTTRTVHRSPRAGTPLEPIATTADGLTLVTGRDDVDSTVTKIYALSPER